MPCKETCCYFCSEGRFYHEMRLGSDFQFCKCLDRGLADVYHDAHSVRVQLGSEGRLPPSCASRGGNRQPTDAGNPLRFAPQNPASTCGSAALPTPACRPGRALAARSSGLLAPCPRPLPPQSGRAQRCRILELTRHFPASQRFPFRTTRENPRSSRALAALKMVKSKTEKDIFAFGQI